MNGMEEDGMYPRPDSSFELRDAAEVATVDFERVFEEARQQSDQFADQNRVTSELLKLEFCI